MNDESCREERSRWTGWIEEDRGICDKMSGSGCWRYLDKSRRANGNGMGGSRWGDGCVLRGIARFGMGGGRGFPNDSEPFYQMNASVQDHHMSSMTRGF